MNLDDLMEVWRSQDTAPLHGVDKTLLRLALRHDEASCGKSGATRDGSRTSRARFSPA